MKISWGIIIILSFVVFAAGIISMVAISMSSSTDLVSENYYEQEIKYQERIDVLNNSARLDESIVVESDNENVKIIVNQENAKNFKGEIYFYRTSDAEKDFKIEFKPTEEGIQTISAGKMDRGIWKIRISLADGDQNYFVEKNIFID